MNRAQRRREQKAANKKPAVYNYTEEQLQELFQKWVKTDPKSDYANGRSDGMRDALALMLAIPVEVGLDYGWDREDIKIFVEDSLALYEKWMNGKIDMEKIRKDVWEYGGVKIVPTNEDSDEESDNNE